MAGPLTAAATADSTITVSVNGGIPQAVTRQGDLFYKQVPVDNASAAQNPTIKITGVKNLVGPNGEDAVTDLIKATYVAHSPGSRWHLLIGSGVFLERKEAGWILPQLGRPGRPRL